MKTTSTLLAALLVATTLCAAAQTPEPPKLPTIALKIKLPDGQTLTSSFQQGSTTRFHNVTKTTYIKSCDSTGFQMGEVEVGVKVDVLASNAKSLRVNVEANQLDGLERFEQQECAVQLLRSSGNSMTTGVLYDAPPQKIGAYEISATRSN